MYIKSIQYQLKLAVSSLRFEQLNSFKELVSFVSGFVPLLFLATACETGVGDSLIFGSSSNLIFSPYNSEIKVSSSKLSAGNSSIVSFILRDNAFHPVIVPGTKVYFYYSGGTSMGFFDSIQDNGNGSYTTAFRAVSAGSANTIHIKVNDEEVTSSFGMPSISVMGGEPTTILPLSGNQQTAPGGSQLPLPFFVIVRDASDTPLPGALVDWRITGGSGVLTFTSTTTDANGLASSILTLGLTPGPMTITATARGTTVGTTFTATSVSIPFTYAWTFNAANSSQFDYDFTRIDFNGLNNSCELSFHSQTDQDNLAAGFGGATLSGLLWDSSRNIIRMDSVQAQTKELSTSNWTPKTANLMAIWHLNDPAGTTSLTDSAGSNTGTASNSTMGVRAQQGTGAMFNGSSSVLDMGTNFDFTSSAFSFSYWINLATFATDSPYGPVPIYKGNYNTNGYYNQIGADGSVLFATNQPGSVQSSATAIGAFGLGAWHHIAITRSGPSVRIYVDGIDATGIAGNHADPGSSNNHFYLGLYPSIPIHMNGSMDEVGVWNATLSAADVANIYQHQKDKFAGTLTSRVFDGFSAAASWTTLAWTSSLPFLKDLPSSNELQSNYPSLMNSSGAIGNSDLSTSLLALWHLNDSSGTVISDSSGNNNNGNLVGTVNLAHAGLFGKAIDLIGNGASYVDFPNTAAFNSSTTTISVSSWVFPTAFGGTIFSRRTGCLSEGFTLTPSSVLTQVGSINFPHVPLNTWSLIVATYNGAQLKAYVNGTLVGSTSTSGSIPGGLRNRIGVREASGECDNAAPLKGSVDEVALWSRALSANDVLQLYRRGGNRISFQVRNCLAADCSDDAADANWKGPDGSNQTYFSELNNNTNPASLTGSIKTTSPILAFSAFASPPSASRFFQYRAVFESDDTSGNCNYGAGPTACSPELRTVSIGPNRNFDSSSPTLITKTGVSYLSLGGFAETLGTSCAQGTTYNLGAGSTSTNALWYYWDGSKAADCLSAGTGAWCVSNGTTAQTSPAAVIAAHAASLAQKAGVGKLFIKTYLNSNGLNACQLQKIDISGQQ